LKEFVPTDKKPQEVPPELKFNPCRGLAVDPHSIVLLDRTNRLLKENSNLTFAEAMTQARKELGDEAPISTFIN
jgi:hypothetical protein